MTTQTGTPGLATLAAEARRSAGLTQDQAATALGVNQSNVSRAETLAADPRFNALRIRMIVELAGWHVEGPLWRITRTPTDQKAESHAERDANHEDVQDD
jgi:transcriptional regulator with XRE-family HTH domain